jgi:outer membrane protein assembly factor BamB
MTPIGRFALTAIFAYTLVGCTSGNNPPTCSFNDPAQFLPTPAPGTSGTPGTGSSWPKFRANVQNTGTVMNVTISAEGKPIFFQPTREAGDPKESPFVASPVLNDGEAFIYIGSTDGTLYRLRTSDLSQDTTFNQVASQAITSTALATLRDGTDAVFVGGAAGSLLGLTDTGDAQANYWPFVFNAFVSASPTMNPSDGTVYVGAESGIFSGICPNGIARFSGSTTSIQSSAAIGPDETVYVGSNDRQLRAVQKDGPFRWAFAASAPIVTAPVVEVQGDSTYVYVADLGGHVFKVNAATGQPVSGFNFQPPVQPISSSPALALDRLYFGSDDGNLYAISTADGSVQWMVPTGGPIVSSPAVAIATDAEGNPTEVIVVVGSKDGDLYFVNDASPDMPRSVALKPGILPDEPVEAIESSPAIGSDGTVYVGTNGGRVYAIR